jgi:hypothetical protein
MAGMTNTIEHQPAGLQFEQQAENRNSVETSNGDLLPEN